MSLSGSVAATSGLAAQILVLNELVIQLREFLRLGMVGASFIRYAS